MEQILILGGLGLLGLMLGSFSGATVWRLRARQLVEDKADGEPVDTKELKHLTKLTKKSFSSDRSQCLHCGHQLAWYDLLPLVSWVQLGGKCRYCQKPIGWFEPLVEFGMALFFILSYVFWPHPLTGPIDFIIFTLWLAAGTGLGILLSYDAKWFLLPNKVMFPVIALAALSAGLHVAVAPRPFETLVSIGLGCVALSGLYLLLYIISKGSWIGFGDIKLGLALALLLADWKLALLALFLSNLVGTIIALPALLTGKINRGSRVPFGPMLIIGWLIAGLWGGEFIDWYLAVSLGL